ncbi:EamA-like transporter domain protein [Lachnoanaerobaculum saburreum F0468]|uniref:EamA-like transporter domain protein n=2 Tax=Lachnoanaerobaculum saburreum TaxID=467210 RepID=I0R8I2_9FIRM|nr:EamA-like transporter domain protein [Lachnoanaerobaculum saburreum F0468]
MKHVSATASGILLSLESVMAAFMGIVVLHEPFTLNLFIGGTIIMFSFVLSEVLPKVTEK